MIIFLLILGILALNIGIFIVKFAEFSSHEKTQKNKEIERLNERVTRLERYIEDFKL